MSGDNIISMNEITTWPLPMNPKTQEISLRRNISYLIMTLEIVTITNHIIWKVIWLIVFMIYYVTCILRNFPLILSELVKCSAVILTNLSASQVIIILFLFDIARNLMLYLVRWSHSSPFTSTLEVNDLSLVPLHVPVSLILRRVFYSNYTSSLQVW